MDSVRNGFSLIELMIVVAIIEILTSVAIAAYPGYATKAKIREGVSLTGSGRTAIGASVRRSIGLRAKVG